MSVLLFRLRNVPEDEAAEVRKLLDDNGIAYYETHAGFFGTSIAGLWLQDNTELERAQSLLSEYQLQRTRRSREEYADRQAAGKADTFWTKIKREPVKMTLYLLAVLVILYISLIPFVRLAGGG